MHGNLADTGLLCRAGSLFFWRDRTREVDFVVDHEGRLELFEGKWTELPTASDAVNLEYVRKAVGKTPVLSAGIVCRTPNASPSMVGFARCRSAIWRRDRQPRGEARQPIR